MSDQKTNFGKSDARSADMPSWNLTAAKTQLSRVVERALQGKPQRIVRSGREAVVVISEDAFERVTSRGKTAVELFSALRGADLALERDRDLGRESEL